MLVNVILVHVVEMAIVKIVHMAVMANCSVPAIRAMLMSVVGVVFLGTSGHVNTPCERSIPIDAPINAANSGIVAQAIEAQSAPPAG